VPTENPGPETHILLKELKGKITDVLDKIPEEFRLPIILVVMGDFSYEEAAEILSCPVGTIRSRLFRGRKLVYKELREYMGIKEKSERKK
jgi:RNA polymerase sigma-70 factor, ECF subfamily